MKTSLIDKTFIMEAINDACKSGARAVKACKIIGLTTRTLQRWNQELSEDKRKGPKAVLHALSQEERAKLVRVANSPEYRNFSPKLIVPMLADQGEYIASESTFYRVLKEEGLLVKRGRQRSTRTVEKPLAVIATKPNTVWSWDITFLKSEVRGMYYYLYLVMDVYSRFIVGWKIMDTQSAEHASELVKGACKTFNVKKKQLILHADNGGPMKGATMLATLQKLGVIPSFSRPAVSDDNPYSEALFKTLKYSPRYPREGFKDIADARSWVEGFVRWYNYEHLHSHIKYVTPASRHEGKDSILLTARKETYLNAKNLHPLRWKNDVRNWDLITEVPLNHINGSEQKVKQQHLMAVRTA